MRKTEANLATAPAWRIAMIMLGIAATPVLLSSGSLGSQLSGSDLLVVVAIGSVILSVIAAITISVGEKGAVAINLLLAVSLFGWIAVTANMFGNSVHDLLAQFGIEVPASLLVVAGCVIFVASTAFGFEVLGRVAQFAVPVIAVVLCYVVYIATYGQASVSTGLSSMNRGVAVSSVVGTIIVLVATLPDFGSFVHNRKHAVIAALLTFLLVYPLLYWAGATPSALTGKDSLLAAMMVFGALLPAGLLMVFVTLTANAGNMFQGTLVVSTLVSRFPKWQITIVLGILAAIVGCMDIMSWFIPFLLFLGIATPPVAGIYIADFFLYRRAGYDETRLASEPQIKLLTFVAWIAGSLVGFATVKGILTLTTIPSLDSILTACVCYAVLSRLAPAREQVAPM
jgi:cytosine permease